MDYKFQRTRIDKIPESKILEELEKAAKHFNYIEFGWRDFDKIADISSGTVENYFGNWKKGLTALKQHLKQKGLDLSPRPYPPNRSYSDRELFEEMERIWRKAGQRPSLVEWEMHNPKVSSGTYKHRFGSWTKACLKFIEDKMGGNIFSDDELSLDQKARNPIGKNDERVVTYKAENSRTIPLGIRLKVLDRDNFRCIFCGRSPATDLGVRLHIDHKIPFSKGGKSTIENLQTLCEECNLGKSNRNI